MNSLGVLFTASYKIRVQEMLIMFNSVKFLAE